jgi:glycosyltransferase involved in cell wall biosynthesis
LFRKSVCLIASGIGGPNGQLQPWRYLAEVACQLAVLGHSVTALSDGEEPLASEMLKSKVKVRRISSVKNPVWKPNHILLDAIHQTAPEVIIWHLGMTSFLYQSIPSDLNIPIVGLFSNPVYHPREFTRLGLRKLLKYRRFIKVHLVGSLAPYWLLHLLTSKNKVNSLVVQTKTTRRSLELAGFWLKPIQVIPPGVDERWSEFDRQKIAAVRSSWGFDKEALVLLYYGSLSELRGLSTLLQALVRARHTLSNLKLVILSRRRPNEWVREDRALNRLLQNHCLQPHVKVISGFLEPDALVSNVADADIITLPFELLPSDAPLSILEVLALGKPIVTTRVACLPELVSSGEGYLAEPGDPNSLSEAIERAAARHLVGPGKILSYPERNVARSWQEMGMEWSNYLQSL